MVMLATRAPAPLPEGFRFPLGRLLITPAARDEILGAGYRPTEYVARHVSGDWGDLCAFDRQANEDALRDGERILSAYRLTTGEKLYVITEWDRSATTVLLAREY